MNDQRTRFWGWPGSANFAYALIVLGIPSGVWFVGVYAGADYLTGLHDYRVPLYHPAELAIPFVPAMAVFYNSLHLAYLVAPFVLRTRPEMNALALVWFVMTLVAGLFFLVIPFEPGFSPPDMTQLGIWRGLYEMADQANLRFNSCPSLHVTWGVACVDVYARHAGRTGKWVLWSWGCGMCLSTLLLHQHH
ncbi:MAG: phosphatase PAP2 family protein, partial [Planctomycetota bacterium]|nr:phosphatase PAP2 family protein [Planctomycetota bacterium]